MARVQPLWKKALGIPRLSTDEKTRAWLLEKLRTYYAGLNEQEPEDLKLWTTKRLWACFYEIAENKVRGRYPELFDEVNLF